MWRYPIASLIGAMPALAVGFYLGVRPAPEPVTVKNLKQFKVGGAKIWNYDFRTRKTRGSKVDWPVNLVFVGHATVPRVKRMLPHFTHGGAPLYEHFVVDGKGYWSSDGGVKTNPCRYHKRTQIQFDYHTRVYGSLHGPHGTGQYVIATSHKDLWDCKPGNPEAAYGWSEDAERFIGRYLRARGFVVRLSDPNQNAKNADDFWMGNHYMQSDGHATIVYVPKKLTKEGKPK